MSYLKALGILRLVAEQKDPNAKGCWRDGVFVLRSNLDENALVEYFVNAYSPTPIFAPWNGDGGFLTDSGKSLEIIEAIRRSTHLSCVGLKEAVRNIDGVQILVEFKKAREKEKTLRKKKKNKNSFSEVDAEELKRAIQRVKEIKETILVEVRNTFPDDVVRWLDTCLAIQPNGFSTSPLLGSGGCDGRLEFSANFLGNLLVYFELDSQQRQDWVLQSLTRRGNINLVETAIGQFSPGHIGGPNATQGMEGDSLVNPLDFVLMLEGSLLFAGSVTRKFGNDGAGKGAFPFTVYASSVGGGMEADKDSKAARGELWLPLWQRYTGLVELKQVLAEGRAELSKQQATSGVQIARAVTSLGVDRGINAFARFGFLQRNGKAYLATPLGLFEVLAKPNVDLLREIDPWLDRFRRAASDDKSPPRFKVALRRIESAVFAFCQYGGAAHFAEILCSLGQAERELSTGEKFREDKRLKPLCGLSPDWIRAASDGSVEFEVALALSGIWDPERKLGSLRTNLESAEAHSTKDGSSFSRWLEKDKAAVWSGGDVVDNLVSVLERRLMDASKFGCERLPIAFRKGVSLDAISSFIHREVDDRKIDELLWGMILIDQWKPLSHLPLRSPVDAPPLPRVFALLKLLFLPFGIGEVSIKPETGVPSLLRAGRIDEACAIAMRRLRASGLSPMPHVRGKNRDGEWKNAVCSIDSRRLAAALLIPVTKNDTDRLVGLIVRPDKESQEAAY